MAAANTGDIESKRKYNFITYLQGATMTFDSRERKKPSMDKLIMTTPLSSELTPKSMKVYALKQPSTMGMKRLMK